MQPTRRTPAEVIAAHDRASRHRETCPDCRPVCDVYLELSRRADAMTRQYVQREKLEDDDVLSSIEYPI